MTPAERQAVIRKSLTIPRAPLPQNELAIENLIEAIQQLERSGDLVALSQAIQMASGAIERIAAQGRAA